MLLSQMSVVLLELFCISSEEMMPRIYPNIDSNQTYIMSKA